MLARTSFRTPEHKQTMEQYFYIGLTLALTTYGQLIVKSRALSLSPLLADGGKLRYLVAMLTDIAVLSALAAALVAGLCWMLVVEKTNLSFAYPFIALSFVLVPLLAMFFFREPISALQVLGLALIVCGVAINAVAR